MYKKLLFVICSISLAACCDPTKTYDRFTKEQLQLLYYLEGQEIIYDIDKSDSINLHVSDQYVGNIPDGEENYDDCDSYYPAYGKATITAATDTSIKFEISIKKSNDQDGISERIKFMGNDFLINDDSLVTFYDTIYLKGIEPFYNVYELSVKDTTGERADLINKVYFSTSYGIIRFERLDGRVYRLRTN